MARHSAQIQNRSYACRARIVAIHRWLGPGFTRRARRVSDKSRRESHLYCSCSCGENAQHRRGGRRYACRCGLPNRCAFAARQLVALGCGDGNCRYAMHRRQIAKARVDSARTDADVNQGSDRPYAAMNCVYGLVAQINYMESERGIFNSACGFWFLRLIFLAAHPGFSKFVD